LGTSTTVSLNADGLLHSTSLTSISKGYALTGNTPLLFSRLHTTHCKLKSLNHAHRSDGFSGVCSCSSAINDTAC